MYYVFMRWLIFGVVVTFLTSCGGGSTPIGTEVPPHTHPLPDHIHDEIPDHTHDDLPAHDHTDDLPNPDHSLRIGEIEGWVSQGIQYIVVPGTRTGSLFALKQIASGDYVRAFLTSPGQFAFSELPLGAYQFVRLEYPLDHLDGSEITEEWLGPTVTLDLAHPWEHDFNFTLPELGAETVHFELHLWGEDFPADTQEMADGFRFADEPNKLYLFGPGRWQAVDPWVVGPWDDFVLDFNNNGDTTEGLPNVPARPMYVGVYRVDLDLTADDIDLSTIDHYYVHGESTIVTPGSQAEPARIDLHFDQAPIRVDL